MLMTLAKTNLFWMAGRCWLVFICRIETGVTLIVNHVEHSSANTLSSISCYFVYPVEVVGLLKTFGE